MRLFGTYTSPYTRIVRIMAIELGFDLPLVEIYWRKTPMELFAMNPRGRIPVLADEGSYVTESRTIVEYLWEKGGDGVFKHGDLRRICGETRWEEEAVLSEVYGALEAVMVLRGLSEPPAIREHPYIERSRQRINHCYAQLDSKAARGYLVEKESFGLSEAALIAASDMIEHWGFCDLAAYSNAHALRMRYSERPSVAQTRPPLTNQA